MIEIFNSNRTLSLGRFRSFKASENTLEAFASAGRLGAIPEVLLCTYYGALPQQEYTASRHNGRWLLQEEPGGRTLPVLI